MVTTRRVGKYEVGRTIGEGTFAKVKFAQNMETGESVAMKILAKSTILRHKMVNQIKREVSIMKIVRHPYIVRLHEVHQGRLSEKGSRSYFQQLIDAVSHCHSKGVYHRDLKPENLLLDSRGNLKVSDFGLSALPKQGVDLLHTTCGTPNYVAPEVLSSHGYDGAAADVWSCGVILYVLMAGYLPFEETDLPTLYQKINVAEFSCPIWSSPGAKLLINRILDPNPRTRITMEGIKDDSWFNESYIPVGHGVEEVNLDDVHAVFDDIEYVTDLRNTESGPLVMNAFEMINLSQGLNLSALFDRRQPAKVIISTIETIGESMGLKVHTRSYKTRLEGISANRTGQFAVVLELHHPSLWLMLGRLLETPLSTTRFTKTLLQNWITSSGNPEEELLILVLLKRFPADAVHAYPRPASS
ncbi:CBL-interacting serine/threonine-protein kinase 24-like protein [Drosera capensis]